MYEVNYHVIVDFNIRYSNGHGLIKTSSYFMIDLCYSPGDYASVLVL
jgi:hypothetical protein